MNLKTLRTKVSDKAFRILSKYISYNTKYKPVGILKASKQNKGGSIEYFEIKPPYSSELNLTSKFIEDCSPYVKPILSVQYPGDYVIKIKDGRIYSLDGANTGVISGDNHLIEPVSFQWSDDKILEGKDNALFKQKVFTKPKKYKGKVFSMLSGGGAITYYYHWLYDAMTKLFHLKESGLLDQIDFFLVPNYVYKYQKEYLDYFGITQERIINAEEVRHIQSDYLFVSSYVIIEDHHPKWACDFLYKSFITPDQRQTRDKLIYIARGDAAVNRKVINEEELIKALKNYGFEIHYLSGLSVVEQAKLFNSAKIVVGAHGAGLSNLVFCEPGTKVLEFYPDNYCRHLFYDICNKRGIAYDYLLCPSEGTANNNTEGQKINMVADVPAIIAKVRSMLN